MPVTLKVQNLSKQLRLGTLGYGTLYRDLQSFWAKVRRTEDPNAKLIRGMQHRLVSKKRDHFWALKDISFEIKQGDILAIVGRNGAGKSTLLRILARITAPTTGTVQYRGRLASMLEIGTGFHPELSGRENIYLNGAILGMSESEIKAKFDDIVEFSEIGAFLDTPVKRYSSGMYIKLAFSVASNLDPDILLIDEVLAVGDLAFQEKCMGRMEDLAKKGKTVIFVSHNIGAVSKLCNRALLLHEGQLISQGSVNEVLKEYFKITSTQKAAVLGERKDRLGTGELMFQDIWFEDSKGHRTTTLVTGDDVRLKVRIRNFTNERRPFYNNLYMTTSLGQPVTDFHFMCDESKHFVEPHSEKIVEFFIPRLALNSGSFFMNTMMRAMDTEIYDFVEQSIGFSVVRGKFYSDDRMLTSEECLVSMDYEPRLTDVSNMPHSLEAQL